MSHIINFKPGFLQGFRRVLEGARREQKITRTRGELKGSKKGFGEGEKVEEGENGVSINK